MSEELRRAVVRRVRERAAEFGLKVEDDPVYLTAMERWITGYITMAEFRTEYLSMLFARSDHDHLRLAFERIKPRTT